MILEKVQGLIASFFWDIWRDCSSYIFFFNEYCYFFRFKVKMLRQFCEIGCIGKFRSLHKEFRACSGAIPTASLPAVKLQLSFLVWCNPGVILDNIIPVGWRVKQVLQKPLPQVSRAEHLEAFIFPHPLRNRWARVSDISSGVVVTPGAEVAATLAFWIICMSAAWPTCWLSGLPGLQSASEPVCSCFSVRSALRPNLAKII